MADAQPRSVTLTGAQLGLLLEGGGLTIGQLCPLRLEPAAAASSGDLRALVDKGLARDDGSVEPSWAPALAVLADPPLRLAAAVGTRDGFQALYAYGTGETLAAYTPVADGLRRLAYPLEPRHVLAFLSEGLGLDLESPRLEVEADLTPTALAALAGMVDGLAERQIEARLARSPAPEGGLHLERIARNVRQADQGDDYRWLGPVIKLISPFAWEADDEAVRAGLEHLAGLGWVERTADGGWAFGSRFQGPAGHLEHHLAYGFLAVARREGGGLARSHLGLLRTLQSLWLLDCRGGQNPKAVLSAPPAPVAMQALDDFLVSLGEGPAAVPEDAASAPPAAASSQGKSEGPLCPQCGRAAGPDDRFCAGCGAAINQ
jgi:hypothetical protein